MVAVPPDTPVAMPEPAATVAMPVFVVLHVPGEVASLSVMDRDGQTALGPVMPGGGRLTVTTAVAVQPVDNV